MLENNFIVESGGKNNLIQLSRKKVTVTDCNTGTSRFQTLDTQSMCLRWPNYFLNLTNYPNENSIFDPHAGGRDS